MSAAVRVLCKPQQLRRPVGTSVQYVAYVPREEHLKFMRHHTGEGPEKMRPMLSWLQLIARGLVIVAGAAVLLALIL